MHVKGFCDISSSIVNQACRQASINLGIKFHLEYDGTTMNVLSVFLRNIY